MPYVDASNPTYKVSSRADGGVMDSGSADQDVLITDRFGHTHAPGLAGASKAGAAIAPTAAAGAAAGASPSASVVANSSDQRGGVSVTTGGSGVGTGVLVTVTFANPFRDGNARVVVTPTNNAPLSTIYVTKTTNGQGQVTGFVINASVAPATGTTYTWDWLVLG